MGQHKAVHIILRARLHSYRIADSPYLARHSTKTVLSGPAVLFDIFVCIYIRQSQVQGNGIVHPCSACLCNHLGLIRPPDPSVSCPSPDVTCQSRGDYHEYITCSGHFLFTEFGNSLKNVVTRYILLISMACILLCVRYSRKLGSKHNIKVSS